MNNEPVKVTEGCHENVLFVCMTISGGWNISYLGLKTNWFLGKVVINFTVIHSYQLKLKCLITSFITSLDYLETIEFFVRILIVATHCHTTDSARILR